MSFADFKKRVQGSDSLDKIKSKIESDGGTASYNDERYWKLSVDSSGSGMAVIRFLPEPAGEDFPYVTWFEHSYKNEETSKWYIERSLTSLGRGTPDPMSEANNILWETGIDSNRKLASKRARKKTYVSNIYVIKDTANPENEGKVMLYKYGKTIYKMIEDSINPPATFDDEPLNPFDLWDGADFKLKAYIDSSSGYRSYGKSGFANPAPLLGGDDKVLEEIYNQLHSLEAENSDDKYKTYDELSKQLDLVLGMTKPKGRANVDEDEADTATTDISAADTSDIDDDDEDDDDYSNFLDS